MTSVSRAGAGLVVALSLVGTMSGTAAASVTKSTQASHRLQAHAAVTAQKLKQEITDKLQELKIFRSVLNDREQLLAAVDSVYAAHVIAIKREIHERVVDLLRAEANEPPNPAVIDLYAKLIAALEVHEEVVTDMWHLNRGTIQAGIKEAERAVQLVEEELRALGVTPPP